MTAAVAPVRAEPHIPGEAGTWVFLFGDMLVFGVFFATFLVERSHARALFHASRQHLHLGLGLTNTLVLLTGSWCVATAIRQLRAGETDRASRLLVAAAGTGAVFVAVKAVEYTLLGRSGHGPQTNHFFLYYVILTALHLVHVVLATTGLLVISRQVRRPLTPTRLAFIEGVGCFWHLVDLLWLVLFPLLYLVS